MTVKKLLVKQKKERKETAEQRKIVAVEEREQEDLEITETLKAVRKSLTGFRPREIDTLWGKGYSLKQGGKFIYITCQFEKHSVRYADDCDRENVWCLCINIGFAINHSLASTSVERFEKDFVQFLNQHKLA